ncbi:DEAD/DEAH box helicase [Candidatus Uhrbacteria bacterium]|nr:DEAD/DEAH box helicase [Candidatus Uhrbacteria bacterium]
MEHTDIRKELAAQTWSLLRGSDSLPKELRPYQRETLESLAKWAEDLSGAQRSYIHHATGLGKTVLFAAMVRACVGLRALIVVPSKVLIVQTARVIAKFVGGMVGHLSSLDEIKDETGRVIATRGHRYQSIVITTDASLKRHPQMIANDYAPHLVIRDECHWGYSDNSKRALMPFHKSVIVGFSATPDYLGTTCKPGYLSVQLDQGRVLYGDPERFARTHFGECLDVRTARWGIENGYLCPLAWGRIEFAASLDGIAVQNSAAGLDYKEVDLQRLMRESWPAACEAVRLLYADPDIRMHERQTIAVCSSVEQARELAASVRKTGIQAACITGSTPEAERDELLTAFNRREVNFLSSVLVLREGWDAPEAEVCLMLRPTRSRVFYEQALGRILRLPESRPDKVALAVDLHFQNTQFAPLSAPVLYGKVGETIEERGVIVSEAAEEGKAMPSPYLPPGAVPKLVVVQGIEIEYYADEHGGFDAEGVRYESLELLSDTLGMSMPALWSLIRPHNRQVRQKRGKNKYNGYITSYAKEDVLFLIRTDPRMAAR